MFSGKNKNSKLHLWALGMVLLLLHGTANAQEEDDKEALQQTQNILELSLEGLGDIEFDYDTYLEELRDLSKNPINLNTAVYEDFQPLLDIGLIGPLQVSNLLKYRDRFGNLLTLYELKYILSWEISDIKKVLPFVYVSGKYDTYKPDIKTLLFKGRHQVFARYTQVLEKQKGYTETDPGSSATRYPGNAGRFYFRYRYNFSRRLSYGFTAEKDPGEAFLKAPQERGFDYYSGHLFATDVGPFKAIALGDYQANIGQGVILWTGFGFAKSPYVMNVKRTGQLLKPYSSVNENNFLRGAATSIEFGDFEFTALFSRNRIDANISEIDTVRDTPVEVSNFQFSGYHRTPSEVRNKDALTWTLAGGHLEYQKRASKIGLTAVQHFFDTRIMPGDQAYQRFYIDNKRFGNYGLDYAVILRKFYLFGESSVDNQLGHAHVHGFAAQLDPRIKMSAVFRYYTKDYRSFGNNSFSENTRVQNETGLYWGWEITPHQKVKIQAFIDYFKFPWLRFGVDGPSSGIEYFAQANFNLHRNIDFYLRYRYKKREQNQSTETNSINAILPETRQSWRGHIGYQLLPFLEGRNRVEFSLFKSNANETDKGLVIYQDLNFSSPDFPLAGNLRFAIFDTESWDTRIYAYENDLLYAFSIPAYYGQGIRFYLNLRWEINRNFDIWLKYAITHFSDRNTISSGLSEIDGNRRSEIRAQIRMQF